MMKIAVVQFDISWENITGNLNRIQHLTQDVNADLIILPEMFSTGFSMTPERMQYKSLIYVGDWLLEFSGKRKGLILGSTIWPENNNFYNRLFCAKDDKLVSYDKKHLFKFGDEHLHYKAGNKKLLFTVNSFKIMPLICYDLRFPVWARNTGNYHILIYVANWPAARQEAWNTLLKARAIENQCYVVGVNRIGTDGRSINYIGGTQVFDYVGNNILDMKMDEGVGIVELEMNELLDFRKKYPFLEDRDEFTMK